MCDTQMLPNWIAHIIDPAHPVVFVNTDEVRINMIIINGSVRNDHLLIVQVSGDKREMRGSHDQIYNELEAEMVTKLVTSLISVSCSLLSHNGI